MSEQNPTEKIDFELVKTQFGKVKWIYIPFRSNASGKKQLFFYPRCLGRQGF